LADQAKNPFDLLKNAVKKERWVTELEQELKQAREMATAEKKKLEDELAEEKRKAKDATAKSNALTISKLEVLC
jgi:hypothetical protein